MIDDMHERGHTLLLEPAARTAHLNISRPLAFARERFENDRNYAAARSADWSRARRALYALATPLIPAVRLRRILVQIGRAGLREALVPHVLPALVMGLAISALGELLGYAVGPGRTDVLYRSEIDRTAFVRTAPGSGRAAAP